MDYLIAMLIGTIIAATLAAQQLTVTAEPGSRWSAFKTFSWTLVRIIAAVIAAWAVLFLMFSTMM